ncbi:hypothetical protein BD413DRAFT_193756 [Trametes elegans]|nr:hypothetical protein BD413DRAFT_193756 [Trametes elegans]
MSAVAAQIARSRELVMLIFSHLERARCDPEALQKEKSRRKQAKKTLTRFARVCQTFPAPALDLLWRVLDDIRPILALLPPLTSGYRHTHVLSRDITQAEWDRLQS